MSLVRSDEPVSTTIISSTRSATDMRQGEILASSFLAIRQREIFPLVMASSLPAPGTELLAEICLGMRITSDISDSVPERPCARKSHSLHDRWSTPRLHFAN